MRCLNSEERLIIGLKYVSIGLKYRRKGVFLSKLSISKGINVVFFLNVSFFQVFTPLLTNVCAILVFNSTLY